MKRNREESSKRERREFSKEFKLEAVHLATSGVKDDALANAESLRL
ncbi:MAG: hypothetical protein ABIQ55_05705 [Gemmatimonadaceae bacterium]